MRTVAAITMAAVLSTTSSPAGQDPDQQRPVFRAGAHFVRVDVYPTRNGQPVTGLTAADFELLEDGRPQAIETIEFIESAVFTTNADRRDPNSQRGGFELARTCCISTRSTSHTRVGRASACRSSTSSIAWSDRAISSAC